MAKNIKGITVEIGGNTTGLGKALEGVNKQSRGLQSELRTVDNLLKLDPGNLTLVKQKQDILTDSISATSDKLKTLKEAQSQVEEQFKSGKIGRDQYIAFQKELTNTERKLKDLEKQKDSVNKISAAFETGKEKVKDFGKNIKDKITPEPVKKVGEAFQTAKKTIKDVGETLSPVKEKLEGVASAAKKVGSATAKISAAGIKTVGSAVNVAAKGLKAYALAATGVGTSLFALSAKSAAWADDLNTLSQKTGLTTSELQKFQYASEIIDVDMDTLTKSMARNIRSMNSARSGTGATAEAYKNLGVSVTDANGNLRDNQDVFNESIKSLGEIESQTERDAIAMELFGRSAQDLTPLIEGGVDAMNELGDSAEKMGLILSQEAIDDLHSFSDSIDILKANTKQCGNILAGTFAGKFKVFTDLIGGELPEVTALFANLFGGGDFEGNTAKFTDKLTELGGSIIDKVVDSLPSFIDGFNGLILGVVGAINNTLPTIITTILPTLITGFTGLVLGLVDMVPTLLPTLVDGALVLFLGLLDGLNLVIAQLMPMLPQLITDIVDTLIVNLPAIIEGGFTLIIGLITGITDCIPTLVDKVIELIPVITTALTDNLPKLIEAGLQLIVALATGLPKAIPDIIRALPEIINCIIDTLMEQDWLQIGIDILKGIASGLVEGVKAIGDTIASVAGNVVGGFKKFFGIASPSKLFKKEIGPYLAQGIGVGFEDEMVGITKDMQNAIPMSFETDINANYNGASRNNSTGMAGSSNMTNTINIFANVSSDYDIKRMIGRISTELEGLKTKEFAVVGG